MKPREFWIFQEREVWDGPNLASEHEKKDLIHVREVMPDDYEFCVKLSEKFDRTQRALEKAKEYLMDDEKEEIEAIERGEK